MNFRLAIDLTALLFLALAPQCADAQFLHNFTLKAVIFGVGGGGSATSTSGRGGSGTPPPPSYCSTYCPSYVSTGGVSGKRTGEAGYVATSYGPAGPLNTSYYSAPDYTGQALTPAMANDQKCPTTFVSNTTYNWCKYTTTLSLTGLTNVKFHGCQIFSGGSGFYTMIDLRSATNITFEYCEMRPPPSIKFQRAVPGGDPVTSEFCVSNGTGSSITLSHVDCWGAADGVSTGLAPGSATLNYVWIHNPRDPSTSADHTDGTLDNCFQTTCTSQTLTMAYSTIAAPGNTNGVAQQNGSGNGYTNTSITHSYFSGFGYTLNLCGSGRGCSLGANNVFTDNQFGDDFLPVYSSLYGNVYAHFVWRRNTWLSTPGGYDSANSAAHNGKYYLPNSTWSNTDFTGT